jgi:hypothetical protein
MDFIGMIPAFENFAALFRRLFARLLARWAQHRAQPQ